MMIVDNITQLLYTVCYYIALHITWVPYTLRRVNVIYDTIRIMGVSSL